MVDEPQKLDTANTPALEESDIQELPSGDDVAAQALASQAGSDSDDSTDSEVEESNKVADTVFALQNLIERNADQLDQVKETVKKMREQLKSVFENDVQLAEAEEESKAITSKVKERKSQLQGDATVQRLRVEISEMKDKQKDLEEALSNHLVNYYSLTNSKSFDTSDGDQREFDIRARVKGRRK